MENRLHIPVLLNEVIQYLDVSQGGVFIDGTFGAGGYSGAILNANKNAHIIAFDKDPNAIATAQKMQADFAPRFSFHHACFGQMGQLVAGKVDGIVLDLGVSSMQIDTPERGFSFRFDGPLDMRMAQSGKSAKEVVNTYSDEKIADILYLYGQEKASRRIARAIVQARGDKDITTTSQLAEIIHRVMPRPKDGSDSAMRSFQALRIYVNDELGALNRALEASLSLLKPNGRLVVVSFHSLEDKIVKNFLITHSALRPNGNRHLLSPEIMNFVPDFKVITKKPVSPSVDELTYNPRSHSAKLRAGVRLEGEGMCGNF